MEAQKSHMTKIMHPSSILALCIVLKLHAENRHLGNDKISLKKEMNLFLILARKR